MQTQIKKIGSSLFIEIPEAVRKLYQLKKTNKITMYVIEKEKGLIVNCFFNLDDDLKQ